MPSHALQASTCLDPTFHAADAIGLDCKHTSEAGIPHPPAPVGNGDTVRFVTYQPRESGGGSRSPPCDPGELARGRRNLSAPNRTKRTVSPDHRTLVYDGDCALCSATVGALVRLRLVPPERCVSSGALDGAELDRLRAAGLRNEMAVRGDGDEVRLGAAGLVWLLRTSWIGPLARLADLPPSRPLVRGLYRFVATNRRSIAPPSRPAVACACEPDPHAGYQGTFVLLCGGLALAALWLLTAGDLVATALTSGGWLVLAAASLRLIPELRLRYLGHLAATAAAGALIAAPALALPGSARVLRAALGVVALLWMVLMQRKRLRHLGLGPGWIAAWLALVPTGAATARWLGP